MVRHNAFLLATSEENNYDLNKYYEQARREMESDDDPSADDKEDEDENEHVSFDCNSI